MADSVGPDEMAYYEPSHLGLHSLQNYLLVCRAERVKKSFAGLHSTVGSATDCRSRGCKLESLLGHISYVEVDHEIVSTVVLPFILIQEGHLSVSGKSMCTSIFSG